MASAAGCALFVLAHPDDESMFCCPVILDLVDQGLRVALLCLSTGNADGLGKLRSQELYHACSLLGMYREDVMVIDDPQLQDGMRQQWAAAAVAEHVAQAVQRLRPSRVYTFDAGGVSGHPNHLAVCVGVLRWWAAQPSSSSAARLPQLWQLESVGQLRKYLGPADVPLSCLALRVEAAWQRRWRRQAQHERVEQQQGPARAWHVCRHPRRAWRALLAHRSQMVWYRRLWLLFSRYMYVNTLVRRL